MSRVQLALRVADLEGSIAFYSKLFGTTPAKRRPGYANFAIAEPPLKLVLLEGDSDTPTRLDHLGVEVEDTAQVAAATARLSGEGLPTDLEEQTTCCYAVQDKVWVTGPGAERWEVYTVLADSRPELEGRTDAADGCDTGDGCCAPKTQGTELLEVSALLEVPAAPSTACC
ncbi:catechol 2,3-dioxygenase-like lactoylglutathione lyase family enzyme [Catenulispora sp. MAP12-49]|uniref:ArsI/CadI family heavy metal resistance metalloenzyme n=1 Tax=Catenulispora sp. MAP12-49 TaxID=3156302 RepID=UPI0035172217